VGRAFELIVYTLFAPLPLATFASDVSSDVGKGFVKTYIAAVLQVTVIVLMFFAFAAMNGFVGNPDNGFGNVALIRIIVLISLGLGVMKSGAWARKLCGAG
jgi:hypothetical protein